MEQWFYDFEIFLFILSLFFCVVHTAFRFCGKCVQDNGTEQPTGPPQQAGTLQEAIEQQWSGQPAGQKENTAETGGERYSFVGYAEDGKGIYKSNFPKGTPRIAKGERVLRYIQDVWSKRPITLRIEKNGDTRYIEAQFDPTYDPSGNNPTDASKLMGGNRHGTAAEQRVTLDLADDYYQLASEARYNYSKEETGKEADTHKDVNWWHYFVNDIYFSEYDSEDLVPYTVSINVKEKDDGSYVYSFSAEKTEKNREPSTQQTLHAAVNATKGDGANGKSSIDSIRNQIENVNRKIQAVFKKVSPNHAEQMKRYTELKDTDPEAAQRFYDGKMESQYRAEFEECFSFPSGFVSLRDQSADWSWQSPSILRFFQRRSLRQKGLVCIFFRVGERK